MTNNVDTITLSGSDTCTVDLSDTITIDFNNVYLDSMNSDCGYAHAWDSISPRNQIDLSGPDADIIINGQGLNDRLSKIEDRLAILVTNPELEKEWEELKQLGERYRQLEADLKQKQTAWNALKQT